MPIAQDLRYAARILRRNPGFAAVVVLTLALGIGANTVIFSTIDAVLLRPLPYPQPDRLVEIEETHPVLHHIQAPYADYRDWLHQSASFEQLAAYTFEGLRQVNLVTGGEPIQLAGSLVTDNLLPTLGIVPEKGRNFNADEVRPGHDKVVILSHSLWVKRFGSNPNILSTQLAIDGVIMRVVGVLPASGQFPLWADLLMPVSLLGDSDLTSRKHHPLEAIGRLKPGVSIEQAQSEIRAIARRLQTAYPATNSTIGAELLPLSEQVSGAVRRPLLIVMAAVGIVLLMTCANVANLLLARSATRRREIAIRVALGASRARLLTQFLTESLLLSLIGGTMGLVILALSAPALRAWTRDFLPRSAGIGVSGSVLLFTSVVTLLTAVAFGMAPAARTARHAGRYSRGASRLRNALAIAEIGMAVIVLTCAGLLIRSFSRLTAVDPGFRPDHLLTFRLSLPPNRYTTYPQVLTFYRQLLPALRQLPGVSAAELTSAAPLTVTNSATRFAVDGAPPPAAGQFPVAQVRVVTPGYFDAMVIPVREGRTFSAEEMEATASPVCLINESMARRFYPGRSAIGRKVMLGVLDPKPQATPIVGVVADTREKELAMDAEPQIYFPGFSAAGTVVLRTRAEPLSLAEPAQRAVHTVDPSQPLARIQTMDSIVNASLARRRFSLRLLEGFGMLALLLACTGLYGVISYSVEQRTHELGLRHALGGLPSELIRMIFVEGLQLIALGLAVGAVAAALATRVMSTLLYRTSATDLLTFVSAGLILGMVSAFACLLPAWRVSRVDPMVALRSE